jgi:class 3 adenylate cyclase
MQSGSNVHLRSTTYHFIFMDIVGFSSPGISAEDQARMISSLNKFVQESDIIQKSDRQSLIIRSTGDGMVIGFPDSKESPCLLAIELQRKLRRLKRYRSIDRQKWLGTRIGLHSGDVYPVKDVNGVDDVCGPGIILAQRVMDFGDAGHILASDKFADDLFRLS